MVKSNRFSRSAWSASIFALAIATAQPAYAQTDGTIQGHVDGAKAGDQVVAVDANTGQRLTGTIDANGNYVILGVRPSTYRVTLGDKTQDATVLVGQSAVVDFESATAEDGGKGAVVITGRRAQPAQAQAVTTNITPSQIENLPQNSRNFLSFAATGQRATTAGRSQMLATRS